MHVDDLASAAVFLAEKYDEEEIINVGVGNDVTIAELAELVKEAVGYPGQIIYDTTKPDGTPRKLMDSSRLHALGWTPKIPLSEGTKSTYAWYLEQLQRGDQAPRGAASSPVHSRSART
jgi:GDP-L-fucose synthase